MKRFFSVFDLSYLHETIRRSPKSELLIVTSHHCPWCREFEPVWEEIEPDLEDLYDLSTLEVEDVGGEEVFVDGFSYFFNIGQHMPIGFPSIYVLHNPTDISLVSPEVFWDPENKELKVDTLIEYLRTEASK